MVTRYEVRLYIVHVIIWVEGVEIVVDVMIEVMIGKVDIVVEVIIDVEFAVHAVLELLVDVVW